MYYVIIMYVMYYVIYMYYNSIKFKDFKILSNY